MRTLVCGDIHGGLKALKEVLEKSNYNSDEDLLICLGDYVDRLDQSAEVVRLLIDIKTKAKIKPIYIRGNHDVWVEDYLTKGEKPLNWSQNGGDATIESYINTGYLKDKAHVKFFKELINYHVDDQNRGFVHGGFTHKKGLGHEQHQSDYYWDRSLWNFAEFREAPKHIEVFVGHTPTLNWEDENGNPITVPMKRHNIWNVDTGICYGGKITIMDIDTKGFWQSENK